MGILESAERSFRGAPSNQTAGEFLNILLLSMENDIIEDDAFFDGLAEIRDYLKR